MPRRDFLKTAVLAQVAPAAPKSQNHSSVMLWTLKGSFEEKMETAARAGLQSVELVAKHVNWTDADIARVLNRCRSFNPGIDTIIATPDWGKRPVSMVDPSQRAVFLADVNQAIAFARKLQIPQIILMSGNAIPGRTHDEQYASLLEGTKRAGDLAARAGVTLIVEPLNSLVDHKGCFLHTCTEGLKHDPGTGEIAYRNVYKAIQKTGGYLTMEYLPLGNQIPSLTKAVDGFRSALM